MRVEAEHRAAAQLRRPLLDGADVEVAVLDRPREIPLLERRSHRGVLARRHTAPEHQRLGAPAHAGPQRADQHVAPPWLGQPDRPDLPTPRRAQPVCVCDVEHVLCLAFVRHRCVVRPAVPGGSHRCPPQVLGGARLGTWTRESLARGADLWARVRSVNEPRSAAMSVMAEATAIRPFRIEVPQEQLADLRRRIEATRWPSEELVADRAQGVQLATLQALARYWTTEYDWRRCRGETERAAAVHDRDRRGRDPLHPRQVAARERACR